MSVGEARIRALEERNRKVIEALPEFIFIMDDRFFITDVLMASALRPFHFPADCGSGIRKDAV